MLVTVRFDSGEFVCTIWAQCIICFSLVIEHIHRKMSPNQKAGILGRFSRCRLYLSCLQCSIDRRATYVVTSLWEYSPLTRYRAQQRTPRAKRIKMGVSTFHGAIWSIFSSTSTCWMTIECRVFHTACRSQQMASCVLGLCNNPELVPV